METLPTETLACIISKLPTGARTVCRGVCRRLCAIDDNVRSVRITGILPSSRHFDAKFPKAVALEIRGILDEPLQDFLLANEVFLRQLQSLTIYPPDLNSRRWLVGWICASCINLQQLDLPAQGLWGPSDNRDKPNFPSAAIWALARLSGLRTLDLGHWHIPTPARDFAALVGFTNLSSLSFSCQGLRAQDIQLLSTLGRLNHLRVDSVSRLSEWGSVTHVLQAAALVTPLRDLELYDFRMARIKADDLPALASFRNLERLLIVGFGLVDMMLLSRALQPLTTLTTLVFRYVESYADAELGFSPMKHLRHLSMDWSPPNDEMPFAGFLQACHDNLPSLERLELHKPAITADAIQMEAVTKLTSLTQLVLFTLMRGVQVDPLEALPVGLLHHMTGLRVLRCGAVLDEAALTSLASMPVLEELHVHEVRPLVQPLQRQFSNLRKFGFSECIAEGDSAAMLFSAMPDLLELNADWSRLSGDGLNEVGLALPRSLTCLTLHSMDVCESEGFEITAELENLVELHLHCCKALTLSTVERILRRRYLDKLRVIGCPLISKDELRAILLQHGRADLAYPM